MAASAGAPLVSLHCAHLTKEVNWICQQEEVAKDNAEDKAVGGVAGAAIWELASGWRDQEPGKQQEHRIHAVAGLRGQRPS